MNTTFNSSLGFGNGAFGQRRITRPMTLPATPSPMGSSKPGSYAVPSKRLDLAFPPLGKSVPRPSESKWSKGKVSEMFTEKPKAEELEAEEEVILPLPKVDSYMQKVAGRQVETIRRKEAEEDKALRAYCSFIPSGRY
jgi:hypothetical protein